MQNQGWDRLTVIGVQERVLSEIVGETCGSLGASGCSSAQAL